MIYDEQYLRGSPKGWTVPPDYHETFGRGGPVANGIRFGRFGLLSGRFLYTTWRPMAPLSDAVYAAGKTTVFDHHVSNLVTPPFEIKLDYVTFLLSGGHMPGRACVNLLVDGKVVRTATGRNDDVLEFVAFDVKAFRGRKAQIQVLDTSIAAFAYITVDCICQSPGPKGAGRIIAGPPSVAKTVARAQTTSGRIKGRAEIAKGRLLLGNKAVAWKNLLLLKTGIPLAGKISGKRLELVNGDLLKADVLRLEEEKLIVRHAVTGEVRIPVRHVAQAFFSPGPPVEAEPGVLVHSNGSKIPGDLLWIREDNIAIKCKLGVIPLPRARVRSFVFNARTPPAAAADTVLLADGSTMSGTLTPGEENLVLTHGALGPMKLAVTDVARITRRHPGIIRLTSLRGEIRERLGPIPPPAPSRVQGESGEALRMFPRTVIRYTLPPAARAGRLRATLAPVANSRVPMTAHIRAGDKEWTYTVDPHKAGASIDLALGPAGEIEIITDCPETISYPCGIEWRDAFVVKDSQR